MSVRAMLRRAGAMTLLVYAVHTLAACALGAPLGADFAGALAQNLYRTRVDAGDTALLLELGARRLPELFTAGIAAALGYALLAPLLRVAWAHAMARTSSLSACLGHGVRKYPAALGIGVAALLCSAALIGAIALVLAAVNALSPTLAAERAARAGCVVLVAAAWLLVSTLHDLAVTSLALGSSLRHAFDAAQRALSLRTLASHALAALAIAACFAVAEAIGRGAASVAGPSIVLALQQSLVFAATLLRGAWLANALARVSRPRS